MTTTGMKYSVSNASTSSSNRTGAIVGGCRGKWCRTVLPLTSSFQGLPLLQFHVSIAGLPVYELASSCTQVLAKLPSLSCKTLSNVTYRPKWHSIRILDAYGQSSQRRASRGAGDGSSSEEADETDGEIVEEITQEVEEAQGNEDNDSDTNGEKQGARQEGPDQSGNGTGADEVNDDDITLQNKEAEAGPWWRFWEQGQNREDVVSLGFEEQSLLQDLESLTFNWRDVLDPTWDNVLALGFTALLTLALFKILVQGALVMITILASAFKYTVLGALVLGLLVFLI